MDSKEDKKALRRAKRTFEMVDLVSPSWTIQVPRKKPPHKVISKVGREKAVWAADKFIEYFENFTSDDFFTLESNKNKFKEITWLKMAEYQKRYSELTELYKTYKTEYIDSLIFTEYPEIKELLDDIFKLNY